MALKVRLKPNERMIIAGAAVTNGGAPATLIIGNKVPILREKDVLTEEQARSPARRIYFVIQLMYLEPEGLSAHHGLYWKLTGDFLKAVPSSLQLIDMMNRQVLCERYYEALKLARRLISYEESILAKAGKTPAESGNS